MTLQEPNVDLQICGDETCEAQSQCPVGCVCGLIIQEKVWCYYATLVSCGEELTCENHGNCPEGCFCRYPGKNGCFITTDFDTYIDWESVDPDSTSAENTDSRTIRDLDNGQHSDNDTIMDDYGSNTTIRGSDSD